MTQSERPPVRSYAGGLSRRQFIAIVSLFWVYVTVSNVLYAYSMRTGISRTTNEPLFAPWDMRVLQHLLLLPFLAVAFWASLRLQWRPLWVMLPLQVLLGAGFAAAAYPAMLAAQALLAGTSWHTHTMEHPSGPFYLDSTSLSFWMASFVSVLPSYGFGLALMTGLALYTRFRNAELRMAALERDWSAARLAALRMQLSPHTLFNLLHTIRGHIEWDPPAAQSMVVQLADLLRRLLSAGERDFSTLTDELQFVKHYLELQQRRFADRLSVDLPGTHELPQAWVPSLIVQPLIENAVIHGLAGHQGPVAVRVAVRAEHGTLTLRISNTVALLAPPRKEGIGIRNVRERLSVQFEGRAVLRAGPEGPLWVSEISMPALLDSPERSTVNRAARGVDA